MRRYKGKTISFRLLTLLLIIFMLLVALVTINNTIAIKDIQNNAYLTMEENLKMYNNRLNDNFNKVENYLVNFAYDDMDIRIIDTKDRSSSQWFSALYRLQKNLVSAIPIYKMNGFFIYSVPSDTVITETESNFSHKTLALIKETICPLMKDNRLVYKDNKNKWFPVLIEDQYYLFRVLRIHDSYVGTWISTDAALSPLIGNGLNEHIFLVNHDGIILSKNSPVASLSTSILAYQDTYHQLEIDNIVNLLVPVKVDFMDSYIVSLIPKNHFFIGTRHYITFLIVALLFIFCLMILAVIITNRLVIQPLFHLLTAISSLRNGNLETVVNNKNVSAEFNDVYQAFNEMVGEIKTLKIDIYEEKLSRQSVGMQYLKLQMAPHFLINCISMVYHLLELSKYDLSKIMLKDLSNHLRYTLSSGETVSLEQEIMHVENYIELSKIRYPGSVHLYSDYAEESLQATVIPLLINNFVENTIKYEAVMDKPIEIHITSALLKRDHRDYITICIWDTGAGFHKEILHKLQNMSQYVSENPSKHIGISNVIERASFVFGMNDCQFQFSNRPGAGAQIDIELPYIPFYKEEGH